MARESLDSVWLSNSQGITLDCVWSSNGQGIFLDSLSTLQFLGMVNWPWSSCTFGTVVIIWDFWTAFSLSKVKAIAGARTVLTWIYQCVQWFWCFLPWLCCGLYFIYSDIIMLLEFSQSHLQKKSIKIKSFPFANIRHFFFFTWSFISLEPEVRCVAFFFRCRVTILRVKIVIIFLIDYCHPSLSALTT